MPPFTLHQNIRIAYWLDQVHSARDGVDLFRITLKLNYLRIGTSFLSAYFHPLISDCAYVWIRSIMQYSCKSSHYMTSIVYHLQIVMSRITSCVKLAFTDRTIPIQLSMKYSVAVRCLIFIHEAGEVVKVTRARRS